MTRSEVQVPHRPPLCGVFCLVKYNRHMAIEAFRGDYYPFSNMYPLETWIKADCGEDVPTSEHAYMANRFSLYDDQLKVALARGSAADNFSAKHGVAAKERAYELIREGAVLIDERNVARIALMKRVVQLKLENNEHIKELLEGTGDQSIYEGNSWGDRFWGVSPVGSCQGYNNLGQILMSLRQEF